jgi:integrase
MARSLIPSDTTIRNIKPGDPRKRLSDGDGLYLLLFVKGGAHGWRLDYTINGKRKTLSLGTYPDTRLKVAREQADQARELVAAGADPSDRRKATKAQHAQNREAKDRQAAGLPTVGSFEEVAREWFNIRRGDWAASYGDKIIRRLEVDVFPWLGRDQVGGITPPQLLEVMRKIEARGVIETAHRALENCGQVFRYAVATGSAVSNPARDLKDALLKPVGKHFPAITDPLRLGELLRACHGYRGTRVVRAALQLAPMLFLRPGELRHAQWAEFDLDAALWIVPAERMKREKDGKLNGKPHIVPLPLQAVATLRELHTVTGTGVYVFRGERHHHRPMSENTVNAALRAMGFGADEVVGHGFRATARTMMVEQMTGIDPQIVEAQLAHSKSGPLGSAYDRAEYMGQRYKMMQNWADYLDKLCKGADIIPLPQRAA